MIQVNRLNGRIIKLERERDELVRANLKLRDFLLQRANACERCGGSGSINQLKDKALPYLGTTPVPCPDCADLRKVLD
jgi:DnaJ-class molecular chaperone